MGVNVGISVAVGMAAVREIGLQPTAAQLAMSKQMAIPFEYTDVFIISACAKKRIGSRDRRSICMDRHRGRKDGVASHIRKEANIFSVRVVEINLENFTPAQTGAVPFFNLL